jgi:hypothetical protein
VDRDGAERSKNIALTVRKQPELIGALSCGSLHKASGDGPLKETNMASMYLGEVAAPDFAFSGAVGMLDIVAALQWVRKNIESFGGDP